MANRTLGEGLREMRQRILLLERRLLRSVSDARVPIGVPLPFLGPASAIPPRYIQPMGQTVSRTTYARLFKVLGTAYGAGNGSTTFKLPDLRERTLVGVSAGSAEFGSVGALFGTKTHTLTTAQMPSHNHGGSTGTTQISGTMGPNAGGSNNYPARGAGAGTQNIAFGGTSHNHSISSQGGGGAHNNIQPSLACYWIMRY